nr:FAD-dependent oxidoreductase [Kordiimonas gwangyangensis]
MAESFDLVVIGGGPGGYVAAIRGAQMGMKVACVEREHLGGICLNWGCIPTKALLRSAEVLHLAKHAADYGLKIDKVDFDLDAIVKRSRGVAKQMNGGIKSLFKKNKVTHIEGEAKIASKGKVAVKGKDGKTTELTAKDVIIATGARARELPHLKADGELVWTYKHALAPNTMPKKLLVIGSGAIGIEFASFFNELGSDVTVVEMMDRVLPVEDADISKFAEKSFKKQGMTIKTKASVTELKKGKDSVTCVVETDGKKEEITVDRVIIAIGITGNVEALALKTWASRLTAAISSPMNGVRPVWTASGQSVTWLAHRGLHTRHRTRHCRC